MKPLLLASSVLLFLLIQSSLPIHGNDIVVGFSLLFEVIESRIISFMHKITILLNVTFDRVANLSELSTVSILLCIVFITVGL